MQVIRIVHMSEILTSSQSWQEDAPIIGEETSSYWHCAIDYGLINPWRSWLRFTGGRSTDMLEADPISLGFISRANGQLETDSEFEEYRQKFGWTDQRDLVVRGVSRRLIDDRHIVRTAEDIVIFCRSNTFDSFSGIDLGITLEFSASLWHPDEHQDPFDHDVVAHQDWVRHDQPVVIALASKTYHPDDCDIKVPSLNTNLYNTRYVYRGDLQDVNGRTIDYRDDVTQARLAVNHSNNGEVWVSDARRGLHGRPIMQFGDDPVIRLFMRGFVAPVERS